MSVKLKEHHQVALSTYMRLLQDLLESTDELRNAILRVEKSDQASADLIAELDGTVFAIEIKSRHLRELTDILLGSAENNEVSQERLSFVPLAAAASYADLSPSTLRNQVHAGRLRAIKLGRNWVTTPRWLFQYLESRH